MTKSPKSSDIFDDLPDLSDAPSPAPSQPARKAPSFTAGLSRGPTRQDEGQGESGEGKRPPRALSLMGNGGTALDKVRSGEVTQIVEKAVDPDLVDVWEGNPRYQNQLNPEKLQDLIESMRAQGQLIPAAARRNGERYEIIYGSRRLFAAKWLKANGYPSFKFKLQIFVVDDETAFRLADEENRNRSDVSAIERARSYADALKAHYNGRQDILAEKLGMGTASMSRFMTIATIPSEITDVIPNLSDLSIREAYSLAKLLDGHERKPQALSAAQAIRDEVGNGARYETAVVLKRIEAALNDGSSPPARSTEPKATLHIKSSAGKPMLEVKTATKGGLMLKIHSNSGAGEEEIVKSVREIMKDHGMLN
ncbi:ParB/RepB/Spo0J family partition protein [Croceicoccus gelatinilyticus]|uniref:ParB/RepB/Spo0J family partition protein n=1 Tax=Croceicoccus gelatinilyticus TaxID=2835536 RepID=UPI001BD0C814|nr:ParB/RepB/Spo0J family partition protein [Croceicoccus gelatinilyticus]MBS7671376.1 ParB/RepB/Spo0J family partition protein [Croceicoccus gelatinilyticus]